MTGKQYEYGVITDEISQDLEEALALARDLGMSYVELGTLWDKQISELDADEIAKAKHLLDQYGLRVHMICGLLFRPFSLSDVDLETLESSPQFLDHIAQLDRSIAVAKALGAPNIRTFAGSREGTGGNPSPRYPDGGGVSDATLAKIAKALRIAAEHAQQQGITLALENARAFYANTGAGQRQVIDAVNHPNLKIIWDPANAFVAGEPSFSDGWEQVKDFTIDVHCKDARVVDAETGLTEWVPIGDGGVDWSGQLTALNPTDISTLTLETHWHPKGSNRGDDTAHVYRQLKAIVDSTLSAES